MKAILFVLALSFSLSALAGSITRIPFGKAGGKAVDLYRLVNKQGMAAEIMTYGATVVSLTAPDRNGRFQDVVCGYGNLADYIKASPYFGCIVGRYGNRIAKGKFSLNGKRYSLAINNGPNSLHGGLKGFDKRVWSAKAEDTRNGPSLVMSYTSVDGEEGYPGRLTVQATYTIANENALRIDYRVSSSEDTVANITNHCYFNLAGPDARDNLDHVLWINADKYTPVDATLIPTGALANVAGTPMDFRNPTPIGARIAMDFEQLKFGGGYDHNWVLNGRMGTLRKSVSVEEPTSGRVMEVWTTEPGVQFYSGNFLDGTNVGKGGKVYTYRFAFCLETQHFPDSPNHANFPSTVVKPGKPYYSTTIYKFKAQ